MFREDVLDEAMELEKRWKETSSRVYGGKEYKATTNSGIPLKPVYGPQDIKEMDWKDIGMPSEYPYTRGIYPMQYQLFPWVNAQIYGYGLPEDTRDRRNYMEEAGSSGYPGMLPMTAMAFDLASGQGFDPDHPRARGRVGQCGVSISTLRDFEILFDGHPIEKMNLGFVVCDVSLIVLAMYIVYAERRGIAKEDLRGDNLNFLYKGWYTDHLAWTPGGGFKQMIELIKYCSRNMPAWNTHCVDGYDVEEAGANAVQELAFMIAGTTYLVEECIKVGLKPDEFLPRFSFKPAVGNDFFEEIAKIRALKRMWAKLAKERFGATNPKAIRPRVLIQTAGSTLIAQQPLNNIVRTTLQTLAAALAGVDGMQVCTYDEPLWIPSEQGLEMALRIQQIIQNESNISNVGDSLGGSYYLEWLTNKLEEEGNKLLKTVEEMGYLRCCENGWLKNEVEREALRYRQAVDAGEKTVVGVNKFTTDEEQEVPTFSTDKIAKATVAKAVDRIKKHREQRDNAKTDKALEDLKEVANSINDRWPDGGDLMPVLLDAVRAEATLGEMAQVLKDIFGYGEPFNQPSWGG